MQVFGNAVKRRIGIALFVDTLEVGLRAIELCPVGFDAFQCLTIDCFFISTLLNYFLDFQADLSFSNIR